LSTTPSPADKEPTRAINFPILRDPVSAFIRDEKPIGARRFPLVHKLIQFADLRRYYSEMREALKSANRQAGSYKGWVTRFKNKAKGLELERRYMK
jgi:hypothetical protein